MVKNSVELPIYIIIIFSRGWFWPSGTVVDCISVCLCPCVNPLLFRAIALHPFKLDYLSTRRRPLRLKRCAYWIVAKMLCHLRYIWSFWSCTVLWLFVCICMYQSFIFHLPGNTNLMSLFHFSTANWSQLLFFTDPMTPWNANLAPSRLCYKSCSACTI